MGLRDWFAEALGMHAHQVPHAQCCSSGYVQGCIGGCTLESYLGDNHCDFYLDCYCEEKDSDCDDNQSNPSAPV